MRMKLETSRPRPHRLHAAITLALAAVLAAAALPAASAPPAHGRGRALAAHARGTGDGHPPRDVRVSPDHVAGSYVRLDGETDAVHEFCGTSRRQQQESSVAVNPRDPDIIAVGAMDVCFGRRNPNPGPPQAQNWAAYYRSTDGGETWQASLFPGYPGDPTQPAETGCVMQADPTLAFDNDGRLYYGGICLVFPGDLQPPEFRIAVATFEDDGSRFERLVQADARPTPVEEPLAAGDRPNLAVDLTDGPGAGNVYVTWTECPAPHPGVCTDSWVVLARSTDHGQTFSEPVRVSPDDGRPYFRSDVAVGPDGAVYVAFLSYPTEGHEGPQDVLVAKSADGGVTFSEARLVEHVVRRFTSDHFRGTGGDRFRNCGDGPYACSSGFNLSVFFPFASVAADEDGVHIVWEAALPSGQGKVFVESSPDGLAWDEPAATIDRFPRGHQWFPNITSADGVISVVFYDSRADAAYSPDRPPGNTADGTNSGPAVDTFVAQSRNGGRSWTTGRLSTVSGQPNFEIYHDARSPWWGDYIGISAVPGGGVFAVWTDSRDIVPGVDTRPDSDPNGFDVHAPCTWIPNTVQGPQTGYLQPRGDDPCLSQGGLDSNIYGAWVDR